MMKCPKCTNDMQTSALVTQLGGEIMVAGTVGTGPRPLSAQVCSACGYTELYAAQYTDAVRQAVREVQTEPEAVPAPGSTPIGA